MTEYTTELSMLESINNELTEDRASEISELLDQWAKSRGLQLIVTPTGYDANRFSYGIEFSRVVHDKDNTPLDKFGADFTNMFRAYGMRLKDLNSVFEVNKKQVKLIGIDKRADLHPIVIEAKNGYRSRITSKDARRCIKYHEEQARVQRRKGVFGRETIEVQSDVKGQGW